jgi:hypothetical protein
MVAGNREGLDQKADGVQYAEPKEHKINFLPIFMQVYNGACCVRSWAPATQRATALSPTKVTKPGLARALRGAPRPSYGALVFALPTLQPYMYTFT